MSIDFYSIRKEFPILQKTINGKPLVYLDNAATTQKPQKVIDTYLDFYKNNNANVHRGKHYLTVQATEAFEQARKTIQQFINAKYDHEIIFTKGTTESVNLIANIFSENYLTQGDEIIITEMEHNTNFLPWKEACNRKNAKLKILPFSDNGILQIEKLPKLINKKTKIIAITHISNVFGLENPIKEITSLAHMFNIPVFVDAAQSVVHKPLDVIQLDCDFLAFSGHKLYAPNGIGVLYGKEKWLDKLPPCQYGGEMVKYATKHKIIYNELPYKFEAGTPNVGGAIALSEAIHYLQNIGWKNIITQEHKLAKYANKKLKEIEDIIIYGVDPTSSLFSFNIKGFHLYDIGLILDNMGIAIRTGYLCAGLVMDHYNVDGMMRASLSFYNTMEEIDLLYESIEKGRKLLKPPKKIV